MSLGHLKHASYGQLAVFTHTVPFVLAGREENAVIEHVG